MLFTSGYTENAIVHGGRLDDGIDLLSKPYTREALARKIRHVLRNQQQRNVAQATAGGPQPQQPQAVGDGLFSPARPLNVLLVEDDALIRFSTAEMLTNLGHSVAEAKDAATALETLDSGAFDVIVTDLALPGMSGEELAALAAERRPGLRIVFATGYELPDGAGRRNGAVLLQKPYDEQSMARALRTAMASPGAADGTRAKRPRVRRPAGRDRPR